MIFTAKNAKNAKAEKKTSSSLLNSSGALGVLGG
jgi:hypothetical protein